MKLSKLLKQNKNGVTFSRLGKNYLPVNYKNGYIVAVTDNEVKKATEKMIYALEKLALDMNLPDYYLGYWQDEKTKLDYLDLSVHITGKKEAEKVARQYNQKAIFDCKKLNCIYV